MTRYLKKLKVRSDSIKLTISTVIYLSQQKKQSGGRLGPKPLFGQSGRMAKVISLTQAFTLISTRVTGTVCFTLHRVFMQKLTLASYLRKSTLKKSAPVFKIS